MTTPIQTPVGETAYQISFRAGGLYFTLHTLADWFKDVLLDDTNLRDFTATPIWNAAGYRGVQYTLVVRDTADRSGAGPSFAGSTADLRRRLDSESLARKAGCSTRTFGWSRSTRPPSLWARSFRPESRGGRTAWQLVAHYSHLASIHAFVTLLLSYQHQDQQPGWSRFRRAAVALR
jgi:hypothetical protein